MSAHLFHSLFVCKFGLTDIDTAGKETTDEEAAVEDTVRKGNKLNVLCSTGAQVTERAEHAD